MKVWWLMMWLENQSREMRYDDGGCGFCPRRKMDVAFTLVHG